jgi:virginiamycin B lyase
VGPDGRIWFTEFSAGKVGAIDTEGRISEAALGSSVYPENLTSGPGGYVWYTERGAQAIEALDQDENVVRHISLMTPPTGIGVAADGSIWFTEIFAAKIGHLQSDGTFVEYGASWLVGPVIITAGPDGNMWFADAGGSLGRVDANGTMTRIPLSTGAVGIAVGPDGNIWFTEPGAGNVGRFVVP